MARLLTPDERARTQSYLAEFRSALEATAQHFPDLAGPPTALSNTRRFDDGELALLREQLVWILRQMSLNRAECLDSALKLHHVLSERLTLPQYLTLGYVEATWGTVYRVTPDEVVRWAHEPALRPQALPIHAWLTFPYLDVVDTAMIPGIRQANPTYAAETDIVIDHPSAWRHGFVYHPVLVGARVVQRLAEP